MNCPICNHAKREEIEQAVLLSNYGSAPGSPSLADIAITYKVPLQDLKVHVLMHTRQGSTESVAGEIKRKEADALAETLSEYFFTLKSTGQEIRVIMNDRDNGGIRTLPKPVVDLYLGLGANIKQITESLVSINLKINGEQDAGTRALGDLISAIRGSDTP